MACKAQAQRDSKPVTKEWLEQKYIIEQLSANDIAAVVGRDSKRVWEWLRDFDIPTRSRGETPQTKSFVKGQTSVFAGHTHTPENKEAMRQRAIADGRVPYLKGGKHHLKGKRGAETPTWKGGVTPERQAFYSSDAWKAAVKAIWARDNAMCRRCGKHHNTTVMRGTFAIHHIVSFANRALRADINNLVLVCRPCHLWIHSRENTQKEFLSA